MNLKSILSLALGIAAIVPASAEITITSPTATRMVVTSIPVNEYAAGRKSIITVVTDTIDVTPGKTASVPTPTFNAVNRISVAEAPQSAETFYTASGDNVNVAIVSLTPLEMNLTGTPLLETMNRIETNLTPVMEKYQSLYNSGGLTDEAMEQIYDDYDAVLKTAIEADPSSSGAVFAVMSMQRPETLIEMFDKLGTDAKSSIIYPLAESAYNRAKRTLEAEAKQKALESGHAPAPDFTLPDLQGKQVSLSSFKGKWVILDFWGSWCIWCVKGFPALKEAYTKYGDKLEIVGVDCGDTVDAWKGAVERFKLPWVQLYNADAPDSVDKLYGIQGFPTKIIIDPEGRIVNITTGEDPSFFDKLDNFINGK